MVTVKAGTAAAVLSVASHEVGYNGTGTEDNPSSKYGAWYGIDGSLGWSDAQWCSMFISWVFDQAKVTQVPAPKGSAAVAALWTAYQQQKRTHSSAANPNPGDLVIFQYGDHPNHVGIVESYSNSTGLITSIQGNTFDSGIGRTGNCCRRKVHGRSYIVGFAVPHYTATGGTSTNLEDWMATEEAAVTKLMEDVVKDLVPGMVRSELRRALANDYGQVSTRCAVKVRDMKFGLGALYGHVLSANSTLRDYLKTVTK